jgi:hypothetical protein
MIIRHVLIVLGTLGVTVGCAASGGSPGETATPHGSATKAGPPRFSGIAIFRSDKPDTGGPGHESLLTIADPQTGRTTARISFPGVTATIQEERDSFSPDWQYVAWLDDDGAIGIGRFAAGQSAYVPVGTVTPPKPGFSGAQVRYGTPRFNPSNGRLWFTVYKSPLDLSLSSVDPRSPTAPPRPERTPAGIRGDWFFDPSGTPASGASREVRLTDASGKKLIFTYAGSASAMARVRIRAAGTSYEEDYKQVANVDATTFLALKSLSPIDRYGPLIEVRVDLSRRRASVTPLVPASTDNTLKAALLGPDRRSLLLGTDRGWFRTEIGTTGEPRRVFDRLEDSELNDFDYLSWL